MAVHLNPTFAILIAISSCFAVPVWAQANQCAGAPVFLSSTDDAYKYLEDEQRVIYSGNPDEADPFSREELSHPGQIKSWEDLVRRLEKIGCDSSGANCIGDPASAISIRHFLDCEPLPTHFESPLTLYMLHLHMEPLEAVRRAEYPGTEAIRFGTLPTGLVDAVTLKVPKTNKNLVIVDRDIFEFTGAFAKSVAAAIPIVTTPAGDGYSASKEAIRKRLRENPEIVSDFVKALVLQVKSGTPAGVDEVALDEPHVRLYRLLLDGMDAFIVGHEEAHALLHHTDEGKRELRFGGVTLSLENVPNVSQKPSPKERTLVIFEHTKLQELDADALSLRLYVKNQKTYDNPYALALDITGADIFFGVAALVDEYAHKYGGYAMTDNAHPSAQERISAIDRVYKDIADQSPKLHGMPDCRTLTRAALAVLVEQADPIIRAELQKSKP